MITRYFSPFGDTLSLRDAMNHLLEGSFIRPGTLPIATGTMTYSFPVNVYQIQDELKIEALLPGVSPEDIQVGVDQGVLTITGKRHVTEPTAGQGIYVQEIYGGQFIRALTLPFPVEVEQATAALTN